MPLYDYQCQACGYIFEIRATFSEKEEGLHPVCPTCRSIQTQQIVSAPLVIRSGGDGGALAPSGCCPTTGPGCCSN